MLITVLTDPAAGCWSVAVMVGWEESEEGRGRVSIWVGVDGKAGIQAAAGVNRQTAVINNPADFAEIRRKFIMYSCIISIA
jgi:hypothetical protein